MINVFDDIHSTLKTYVQAQSSYSPLVKKSLPKQSVQFPLVVIVEIDNREIERTGDRREHRDALSYQVDIYTSERTVSGARVSDVTIANELKGLVDDIMTGYYHMTRTFCQQVPNLADDLYRFTMRYECEVDNRYRLHSIRG